MGDFSVFISVLSGMSIDGIKRFNVEEKDKI
jgi:hypothetical protein